MFCIPLCNANVIYQAFTNNKQMKKYILFYFGSSAVKHKSPPLAYLPSAHPFRP